MAAALFVPWCLVHFGCERGWRMAFILTGAAGLAWLLLWYWLYDTPANQRRLSRPEFDYIHLDADGAGLDMSGDRARIPWTRLLGYRQTWAFFWGKFLTDGVWWFYLFWLPDYFRKQFGMTTEGVRIPTFTVYGVAAVGSILGGRIPMTFINRGLSVYQARGRAMLLIAVFPLVVLSTPYFGSPVHFGGMAAAMAVATIGIAAAAHQAWSANLFTTVSDMFPKKAVGAVTGIGAMAGGLGGIALQKLAGFLTDAFDDRPQSAYASMFLVCACSYLVAWIVMKILVPAAHAHHRPVAGPPAYPGPQRNAGSSSSLKKSLAFEKQMRRTIAPTSAGSPGSSPLSIWEPRRLHRTRLKYSCRG